MHSNQNLRLACLLNRLAGFDGSIALLSQAISFVVTMMHRQKAVDNMDVFRTTRQLFETPVIKRLTLTEDGEIQKRKRLARDFREFVSFVNSWLRLKRFGLRHQHCEVCSFAYLGRSRRGSQHTLRSDVVGPTGVSRSSNRAMDQVPDPREVGTNFQATYFGASTKYGHGPPARKAD
jgi:hypothetical protein